MRGEFVRLDAIWISLLERHAYPKAVREQLGQALAAALFLSASLKFEGSLILQVQGDGPIGTLVAQATHRRTVRGIAYWRGEVPNGSLSEMFGAGRLVLTIQNEGAEPYQGVIALEGQNLAEAIETYFSRSEQLTTRLWLAADRQCAAGMFLQELPSEHCETEDWTRVVMLADTVAEEELLGLPIEHLLYRLFNDERVRLFEPDPVAFVCGCSRNRIETVLLAMGRSEVDAIVAEQGGVEAHCEFCNRRYHLDAVDVGVLFAEDARLMTSRRRH